MNLAEEGADGFYVALVFLPVSIRWKERGRGAGSRRRKPQGVSTKTVLSSALSYMALLGCTSKPWSEIWGKWGCFQEVYEGSGRLRERTSG